MNDEAIKKPQKAVQTEKEKIETPAQPPREIENFSFLSEMIFDESFI